MRCFEQDILNENCFNSDRSIPSFSGYELDNYADFEEDFSLESTLPVRNQRLQKYKSSRNLSSFGKSSQTNKACGFS